MTGADGYIGALAGPLLLQRGQPSYGRQVWAFEITELSTTRYREIPFSEYAVLRLDGADWNILGMHQLDAHEISLDNWIACVDGQTEHWVFSPRDVRLRQPALTRQELVP